MVRVPTPFAATGESGLCLFSTRGVTPIDFTQSTAFTASGKGYDQGILLVNYYSRQILLIIILLDYHGNKCLRRESIDTIAFPFSLSPLKRRST